MNESILTNIFYGIIPDKSFQKEIIEQIDSSLDVQSHNTNVKAKMTSWHMQDKPGFKILHDYVLEFCNDILKNEGLENSANLYIKNMWGMCYMSGEHSISHDHWPATFSCVYYITPPENGPSLSFIDSNIEIIPEDGLLVMFSGFMRHEVKSKSFINKRYAVAMNIFSR